MTEDDFTLEPQEPASLITQTVFRTVENQVRRNRRAAVSTILLTQEVGHTSESASRNLAGSANKHGRSAPFSHQSCLVAVKTRRSIWWSRNAGQGADDPRESGCSGATCSQSIATERGSRSHQCRYNVKRKQRKVRSCCTIAMLKI
jgi:hypothetical protein